jgi:hypothetical protein
MRRLTPFIAATLLLAGCSTAQQRADEAAQKAERAAAQNRADEVECRDYKVPPAGSTEAYNRCLDMLKRTRPEEK